MKLTLAFIAGLAFTLLATGCKGDPGQPGAPGAGRVVRSIYCHGAVSGMVGGAAPLNGLDVEYNAVVTSGGDVYATANIVDDVDQTSGTAFYASAEASASSAAVNVTADYVGTANGGFWSISLDRNSLITSIVYDDISLASAVSLNFTPSACTVSAF